MNVRVDHDPAVATQAGELADAAVAMAARHGDTLDFSEASIALIECILDELAGAFAIGALPEDRAWRLAMVWGSYVGEVFRRAHGGHWGLASVEGEAGEVVCLSHAKISFWPQLRAMKRIAEGSDANVWHFYQHMAAQAG